MPTYAWSHQSYFIEPTVLTADTEDLANLDRIDDISDWGQRPVWLPATFEPADSNAAETWLIFMDEAGVGRRLRTRLQARGHTVVGVHEGDAFNHRSDGDYTLSPEHGRTGYGALIQDLISSGKVPTHIVHLWLVTATERFRPGSSFFHQNLQDGFYSIYFLAQAIAEESVPTPLHLSVVSNGMQSLGADDPEL